MSPHWVLLSHSSRIPSLTGLCNQLSGSRGFSGGKRSELDAAIDKPACRSRVTTWGCNRDKAAWVACCIAKEGRLSLSSR